MGSTRKRFLSSGKCIVSGLLLFLTCITNAQVLKGKIPDEESISFPDSCLEGNKPAN